MVPETSYEPLSTLLFEHFDVRKANAYLSSELHVPQEPYPDTLRWEERSGLTVPTRDGPISAGQAAFSAMRVRAHEWTHHEQHVSTPYGLMMRRLRTLRMTAGARVQEALLERTGRVISLPKVVALNLPDPNSMFEHLESLGVQAATELVLWNAADELVASLTTANLPFNYVQRQWNLIGQLQRHTNLAGDPFDWPQLTASSACRST